MLPFRRVLDERYPSSRAARRIPLDRRQILWAPRFIVRDCRRGANVLGMDIVAGLNLGRLRFPPFLKDPEPPWALIGWMLFAKCAGWNTTAKPARETASGLIDCNCPDARREIFLCHPYFSF